MSGVAGQIDSALEATDVTAPRRLIRVTIASWVVASFLAGCRVPPVDNTDPVTDGGSSAAVDLILGTDAYPTTVLAENALRSDISTQGLEYPDQYSPRINSEVQRHRVGEIVMLIGFALREVSYEPSGNYQNQISTVMSPYMSYVAAIVADGGKVRLQLHCATPKWLSLHPFSHSVQSGADVPSGEPVWACAPPADLETWRAIMRGVGEHFGSFASSVSFSIGSEPDNYFAGSLSELLEWYGATAKGIRESSKGTEYRVGGVTMVGHRGALLSKTAPKLQQGTVRFTEVKYPEPITKTWIEYCASNGLPLNFVSVHQFGGSAAPAVGTYWRRARLDVSAWLTANNYSPEQVDVIFDDWPQWAPYVSNDGAYMAAHVASGIISMLDLTLREGAPVHLTQGFLFDFGFRPSGKFPAGFTGRAGLSNELGIIKPIYNLNSLLAEVSGTLKPVASNDMFVHAVAATGPSHATVLVVNQVPLEHQIDVLYDTWEQTPILENHFVGDDLSAITYDRREIIAKFYKGVMPPWQVLIDAFLADPSSIDLEQLSWPEPIKAQWREMRRVGRLARLKRGSITTIGLHPETLADGTYRVEHYVIDDTHANTYSDREALEKRVAAAKAVSRDRLVQEVLTINGEYDVEAHKLPDQEVVLGQPRVPVAFDMQPNSIHVVRFTALP